MPDWTKAQLDVLKMADEVECDAELLATRLEQEVDAQMKRFQAMKGKPVAHLQSRTRFVSPPSKLPSL